jgi:hypothetical protein
VKVTGSPLPPRSSKTALELGAPVTSSRAVNPHSRQGRTASPHRQGRVMHGLFVGTDVARDRLDVHVRPSGDRFTLATRRRGIGS